MQNYESFCATFVWFELHKCGLPAELRFSGQRIRRGPYCDFLSDFGGFVTAEGKFAPHRHRLRTITRKQSGQEFLQNKMTQNEKIEKFSGFWGPEPPRGVPVVLLPFPWPRSPSPLSPRRFVPVPSPRDFTPLHLGPN